MPQEILNAKPCTATVRVVFGANLMGMHKIGSLWAMSCAYHLMRSRY